MREYFCVRRHQLKLMLARRRDLRSIDLRLDRTRWRRGQVATAWELLPEVRSYVAQVRVPAARDVERAQRREGTGPVPTTGCWASATAASADSERIASARTNMTLQSEQLLTATAFASLRALIEIEQVTKKLGTRVMLIGLNQSRYFTATNWGARPR